MDMLTIVLRMVRESIEATGVPPDALQSALADVDRRARRGFGGESHHISRCPEIPAKTRIVDLLVADPALTPRDVAERLGVTPAYVRIVQQQMRIGR